MYKISNATCPKCGHKVKGVRYVHGGDMTSVPHAGELERTCATCGYSWYINALDDKTTAQLKGNEKEV